MSSRWDEEVDRPPARERYAGPQGGSSISLWSRIGSMEDLGELEKVRFVGEGEGEWERRREEGGAEMARRGSVSTEDVSLRSRISTPVAKLGNEFSDGDVAYRLDRGFRKALHVARDAIVKNPALKQSSLIDGDNFAAVWTAMAWHVYHISMKLPRKIPFTTIATALDLLRRSVRATRL